MKRITSLVFKISKITFCLSLLMSCTNDLAFQKPYSINETGTKQANISSKSVNNISEQQATNVMNKILQRTPFFYFDESSALGFNPTIGVNRQNFTVYFSGKSITVRSLDIGVIGSPGRYGMYADRPTTSIDFSSLTSLDYVKQEDGSYIGYDRKKQESSNIVFEITTDGTYVPVGVRYYYRTNNYRDDCWIAIQWSSVPDFEEIIGY